MKILFLVPYPAEGPSIRYRIEPYLPYLKAANISYKVRPFMHPEYYRIFYKKGKWLLKTAYFFQSMFNRMMDIFCAFECDVIFIHIEALPAGPPFIEWFFSKIKKPMIFDFEDGIYLPRKNKIMNFFKIPTKFFKIVKISGHVIVCNNYLKDFLLPYNTNITVIPTSIDTDMFKPAVMNSSGRDKAVIGWIGSHSTLPFLLELTGVFQQLARRHRFVLKIVGGGKQVDIPGVEIINEDWRLDKDIEDFQSLDIGVYPLPDNEWSMARTPFKTIRYMAAGIPCIVSSVGGNVDMVKDGVNGFLAKTQEEWMDKLSRLIEDSDLRKRIGLSGRKTVEEKYSLEAAAPKFLHIIEEVCKRNQS